MRYELLEAPMTTATGQGNGLINMRQRAAMMGGSLEVHSKSEAVAKALRERLLS